MVSHIIYSTFWNIDIKSIIQIDHIDRNPKNNSIYNLRACNNILNSLNRGIRSDNNTGYVGVRILRDGKYQPVFRGLSYGIFDSPVKAQQHMIENIFPSILTTEELEFCARFHMNNINEYTEKYQQLKKDFYKNKAKTPEKDLLNDDLDKLINECIRSAKRIKLNSSQDKLTYSSLNPLQEEYNNIYDTSFIKTNLSRVTSTQTTTSEVIDLTQDSQSECEVLLTTPSRLTYNYSFHDINCEPNTKRLIQYLPANTRSKEEPQEPISNTDLMEYSETDFSSETNSTNDRAEIRENWMDLDWHWKKEKEEIEVEHNVSQSMKPHEEPGEYNPYEDDYSDYSSNYELDVSDREFDEDEERIQRRFEWY